MSAQILDAIVVGAGFAGLSCLHELRKYEFTCKVFEAGGGMGGVWYWNSYPGARVDSEYFVCQFFQSELGQGFPWTERFPGRDELQDYFKYVDQRQNFSRDIQFNTRVTAASFDSKSNIWNVTTSDFVTTPCRYLLVCTGFGSKRHYPNFPGLEKFIGDCYHTADWISTGKIDFKNKKVAVIGTGASGVQVIQEVGPTVDHLTVLQRTPNFALPMQQKTRKDDWHFLDESELRNVKNENLNTFSGIGMDLNPKRCVDASPEERAAFFENQYKYGGFGLWLGTYHDIFKNLESNQYAYEFWRQKTAGRIKDPVKRELLVPTVPPHPFGCKRPSLEQSYYEVFNQSNVDLVDLRTNPIKEFTEDGIQLENGQKVNVDIIVLATGFDALTGGILDINIKNGEGQTLKEYWKDGIRTLLGMAAPNFPNFFFLYGPHAVTGFANGPTAIKIQSDWLLPLLVWMRINGKQNVVPKENAVENYTAQVHNQWANSLFPLAQSWYQGDNIPGKKVEALNFSGGIPLYRKVLAEYSANDYQGFSFN